MNTPSDLPRRPHSFQSGIVLAVSLLLLLVLTLVGIAAIHSTTLDERLTSDQRDQEAAFQAAEAALRAGESLLQGVSAGDFSNSNGLYDASAAITWRSADWSNSGTDPTLKTIVYKARLDPQPASAPSFYIIKTARVNTAPDANPSTATPEGASTVYEIYARAVGPSGKHAVILESAYIMTASGSITTGGRLSWQQLQ